MRAGFVTPGRRGSARVADVPDPVPGPGEVRVRTLEVALDGTDRELLEGYGTAPEGEEEIIIGHEAVGVVDVPAAGGAGLEPGTTVVPIVRRPDPVPCAACAAGEWDMCLNGRYTERGISGRHGFLSELFVEEPRFLVPIDDRLRPVGVLVEPLAIVEKVLDQIDVMAQRVSVFPKTAAVLGAGPIGLLTALGLRLRSYDVVVFDRSDAGPRRAVVEDCGAELVVASGGPLRDELPAQPQVIIEATGHAPLLVDAVDAVARNGVVCVTGVSFRPVMVDLDIAALNLKLVLHNKVVVGSVNANRRHFDAAVADVARCEERWPGVLALLLTRRLPLADFAAGLEKPPGDIKPVIELASMA